MKIPTFICINYILSTFSILSSRYLRHRIILRSLNKLFSSVQFSRSVVSDSLWPHESGLPVHHHLPEFTQTHVHRVCEAIQPSHPRSSCPFSSCPQSLPASESFPMSQLFGWGGQSTGVSALALFLPKNTQGWSPLEWTRWISLQSKESSQESSPTPQYYLLGYPYLSNGFY